MRALGHALWLGWRSLCHRPGQSLVIVLGVGFALAAPRFTLQASEVVERLWMSRAESSPILLGAKGAPVELTLAGLFFTGRPQDPTPYAAVAEARRWGEAAPLVVRHSAGGAPVVGTSVEYFERRGLVVAEGRRFAVLGEVVAGASVADRAGLKPGDQVRSDGVDLADLSAAAPLLLQVVGVLAATGGPDDGALFTDVRTTWALDGALHGHGAATPETLSKEDADGQALNSAVMLAEEAALESLSGFHLHGSMSDQPISAVLIWPNDTKAQDQLLGEVALHPRLMAVQPPEVMARLWGVALQARRGLWVIFGAVGLTTAAFVAQTLSLSLRLRAPERALWRDLGASRRRVALLVGVELGVLFGAAGLLALGLSALGVWVLRVALTP
ncbi:MAG: hypothetical protein RIT28_2090 [Pseudomonadota bacterium]